MTFSKMSPADKNAVHSLLKGSQDMVRRHAGGTHNAYGPDIFRILQSTDPSQVSSSVSSPRANKA